MQGHSVRPVCPAPSPRVNMQKGGTYLYDKPHWEVTITYEVCITVSSLTASPTFSFLVTISRQTVFCRWPTQVRQHPPDVKFTEATTECCSKQQELIWRLGLTQSMAQKCTTHSSCSQSRAQNPTPWPFVCVTDSGRSLCASPATKHLQPEFCRPWTVIDLLVT
jgi:hypothetical protein